MQHRLFILLPAFGLALVLGCGSGEDSSGRPSPAGAEPGIEGVELPVRIDDRLVRVIDASELERVAPDLTWGEGQAWSLGLLVPGVEFSSSAVEVTARTASGDSVSFSGGDRAEGRLGLLVNRKGRLNLRLLPEAPQPFHGRGGGRGRGGDALLQARDVVSLDIRRQPKPKAPASGAALVLVDGSGERRLLGTPELSNLPAVGPLEGRGDAPGAALAFRLSDLLDRLELSASAVVLVSKGGRELPLQRAHLVTEEKKGVLRVNRRGAWRFQWFDGKNQALADEGLRDVVVIRADGAR